MILTTKRLEASARRGDVVDYTRFRLGGKIVRCPSCGQRGRLSRYRTGGASVTQAAEEHFGGGA